MSHIFTGSKERWEIRKKSPSRCNRSGLWYFWSLGSSKSITNQFGYRRLSQFLQVVSCRMLSCFPVSWFKFWWFCFWKTNSICESIQKQNKFPEISRHSSNLINLSFSSFASFFSALRWSILVALESLHPRSPRGLPLDPAGPNPKLEPSRIIVYKSHVD